MICEGRCMASRTSRRATIPTNGSSNASGHLSLPCTIPRVYDSKQSGASTTLRVVGRGVSEVMTLQSFRQNQRCGHLCGRDIEVHGRQHADLKREAVEPLREAEPLCSVTNSAAPPHHAPQRRRPFCLPGTHQFVPLARRLHLFELLHEGIAHVLPLVLGQLGREVLDLRL